MILPGLIKKGGLNQIATATPATIATLQTESEESVAKVATVAVAAKLEPLPELSPDDKKCIRAWLTHIEETDPDIIAEVLNKCRNEQNARRYFLTLSKVVRQTVPTKTQITCCGCSHFGRINHPHLGHCAKGEPEAIAGLWDRDRRHCEQYKP